MPMCFSAFVLFQSCEQVQPQVESRVWSKAQAVGFAAMGEDMITAPHLHPPTHTTPAPRRPELFCHFLNRWEKWESGQILFNSNQNRNKELVHRISSKTTELCKGSERSTLVKVSHMRSRTEHRMGCVCPTPPSGSFKGRQKKRQL